MPTLPFPKTSRPKEEILASMRAARDRDLQWKNGRVFGLVYHLSDEIEELLKEAYTIFFSENGLNPTAFPSLNKFENEVVAMAVILPHLSSFFFPSPTTKPPTPTPSHQ